jgi:hypothetical protein
VCVCMHQRFQRVKEQYALKEAGRGLNLGRFRLLHEDFGGPN